MMTKLLLRLLNAGMKLSLEERVLLPQAGFEVNGDETLGAHYGPLLSRTRLTPVVDGCTLHLVGQSSKITKGSTIISHFHVCRIFHKQIPHFEMEKNFVPVGTMISSDHYYIV